MSVNMLNFNKYEVLSFDCYGTIIDWESSILFEIRKVLLTHNLSLSDIQILELYAKLESKAEEGEFHNYKTVLRTVMAEIRKEFGFRPNQQELNCLAESLENWQPFSDTVEALQVLKKKYKLAVVSNIDNDLFLFSESHLQVEFDLVITAEDVKSYKPSLNNFKHAINEIGAPKEKILHVAQSIYHDIAPAKTLGLASVWVNRRHSKKGSGATLPAQSKPDLEVFSLKDLTNVIG